jgi:hypothetical protein
MLGVDCVDMVVCYLSCFPKTQAVKPLAKGWVKAGELGQLD